MKKIPDILKIGYQDVKIEICDTEEFDGVYYANRSLIRIKDGLSNQEILNTFIHECIHACVYTYGIKSSFVDDDKEELIVNSLSNALTDVFVRNPDFVDWIRSKLK